MKKIILIVTIVIFVIMLVPIPNRLKDGGTVEYNAIIYKATNYHRINLNSTSGFITGWEIKVLGKTIYKNVTTEFLIEVNDD